MNQANWQQAKQIFYEALALAPAERDEFLNKACAENTELCQQVETLLESYESGFLEDTVVREATDLLVESQIKIGQQIGRYKIESLLGAGGMGEVFLAFDTELKRPVALKVLHAEIADDQERINRFIQEAHAVSALNHPNILTIYEIGSVDGTRFIVSEYVKGKTLRERLKREGLNLEESLEIAVQLSAALDTAHSAGIIHRDIKPENIILREDGLVKVLDFGLAKLVRSKEWRGKEKENSTLEMSFSLFTPHSPLPTPLTLPGMVMGTVAYMSPEQARGRLTDARTDLWSFGVVLYEMICGKLPFEGETTSDVIAAILKTETPSVADIIKDIPPELESIIGKTLEKDLGLRYQTAKELNGNLKQLKKRLEIEAEIGVVGASEKRQKNTNAGEQNTELIRHRPTLSKEYLVSQVKQHKVSFSVLVSLLIITLGASLGSNWLLSNQPTQTISIPLVAWYQADNNATDSISGNNATLHNITFTSGHSGQAFHFVSGHLEIPNSPALELQRLSVSVWVRSLSSGSPGLYNYLLSMGSSNCNGYGAYQLQTDNTGGLRFGIGPFGGVQSPDAGIGIWDGNWHYVVGNYDGSFVRLFVDGTEVGNGTPLPNHKIDYNTLAIKNLIIGDNLMPCSWGDSFNFHGDIDDLKIYNRALSKEEIKGIYGADKLRPQL